MSYPSPSIQYVLEDAQVSQVVTDETYEPILAPLCKALNLPLTRADVAAPEIRPLPDVLPTGRAMILYTSGTTGKPKGVVSTHENLEAQIQTLVRAWDWQPDDHILNVFAATPCTWDRQCAQLCPLDGCLL